MNTCKVDVSPLRLNSYRCSLHQPSIWTQLLLDLMYLYNVFVGERLVGLVVLGVLQQDLVHVRAGVLVQLVAAAEDDQRDLAVAQDRQLVRLLHDAELPLVESHLRHTNLITTGLKRQRLRFY